MAVKPIPEGYHSITPSLIVSDTKKAIAFYQKAFGAKELHVAPGPGGKIMHAEIKIGDSIVMVNDAFPEMGGANAPASDANLPATLHLFVENVDATWERAVGAGAVVVAPLTDMFWGDRYGRVRDPFGHTWSLATRNENLTQEQMQQRQEEAMKMFTK